MRLDAFSLATTRVVTATRSTTVRREQHGTQGGRKLRLEPLEERTLLSVGNGAETPTAPQTPAAILAAFPPGVVGPRPLVPATGSLDVDGNQDADALTDGIVILRHLFGFTGPALTEGALAGNATRTDPTAISSFLNGLATTMLDVDANGQADALTDGVVSLRYLFGFTGDPLVENALGTGAARTDPDAVRSFLDSFLFDNSADLAEGAQLVVEQSLAVALGGPGVRTLWFDLEAQFDTSASAALEDRLLVYLVDPNNPSQTLLDSFGPGTALLALAGTTAEFQPGRVRFDGSRVEIDASGLAATSGRLLFQLINHDVDTGTTVAVRNVESSSDPLAEAGPIFPVDNVAVAAGGALDTGMLTAAPAVEAVLDTVRLDSATGGYTANLRVRNLGAAIGRQVAVVFPGLPAGVTLLNPSGTTTAGDPYINLQAAIHSGGLAQGENSLPVSIRFDDPALVRFPLAPQVFVGGPNRAPTINAVGPLGVVPGQKLRVPIVATDPDGDDVSLSLTSDVPLPNALLDALGVLSFAPAPNQLGMVTFTLVASDGVLATSQMVTLDVQADPVVTTRISGFVQNTAGAALSGLTVEVAALQTTTAVDGSFELDFGAGPLPSQLVRFRGDLLAGPVVYPEITVDASLLLGHGVFDAVDNVIDRPVLLPAINVASGMMINPMIDNSVTTAAILGASLVVAANTAQNGMGSPFIGTLSMTEVPVDRTPVALPESLIPDLAVVIHPSDLRFISFAKLTLPNRGGFAPGTQFDLWTLSPTTGLFVDAGNGQVSANGTVIEPTYRGVERAGLFFYALRPADPLRVADDVFNQSLAGVEQVQTAPLTSEVELHSGAVLETHDLVTYQSRGEIRGLSLRYDSLRADPRPIVHFGYPNVDPPVLAGANAGNLRMVARMMFRGENSAFEVPGAAPQLGLRGGEHFFSIPAAGGTIEAALQADLSAQPTGVYGFDVRLGLLLLDPQQVNFVGASRLETGSLLHVNTTKSSLGSGWGFAGVQEIIETADGSAFLIDGDGSEMLFGSPAMAGQPYLAPPGDFSTLERVDEGAGLIFRRTTPDKTVFRFDAAKRLASVTDSNSNQTRYTFDGQGRLSSWVDPVNLTTTLTYGAGFVEITDPAARITRLDVDADGNLTRITDPDGSQRTFGYDGWHHLINEITKAGFLEQTFYGFHGRATRGILADNSVVHVAPIQVEGLFPPEQTSVPFTAPGQNLSSMAMQSGANGTVSQTGLDQAGQLARWSDLLGCIVAAVNRNPQNLPAAIQSCLGNQFTASYDGNGNLIGIHDLLTGNSLGLDSVDPDPSTTDPALALFPGDLNGDGLDDLLAVTPLSSANPIQLRLFLSNGDGTLANPVPLVPEANGNGRDVAAGDLNGDGILDLAFILVHNGPFGNCDGTLRRTGQAGFCLVTYLGDGAGGFGSRRETPIADDSIQDPAGFLIFDALRLTLGDADGDGDRDAIVRLSVQDSVNPGFSTGVRVLHNTGNGVFSGHEDAMLASTSPESEIYFAGYDRTGDVDGVRGDDLVILQPNQPSISVIIAHATGGGGYDLGPRIPLAFPSPEFVRDYVVSDLNGDGRDDLVLLGSGRFVGQLLQQLSVFLSNGDGTFAAPISINIQPLVRLATTLAVADVNADDRPDIVLGRQDFGGVSVYTGDGMGNFSRTNDFAMGAEHVNIVLLDLDGDDSPDFVTSNNLRNSGQHGTLSVSRNDGAGNAVAFARARQTITYDPVFNQATSSIDVLGRQTIYNIDPANGNTVSDTRVVGTPGGGDDITTAYTYTADGLVDTVTDPSGIVTDNDYNPLGRLVQVTYAVGTPDQATRRFEYDTAGNQTAVINENGNRTQYVYDAANRLLQLITADPDSIGPQTPSITTFGYDPAGNQTAVTDTLGNVTASEFDSMGRVVRRIDPDPDGGGPLGPGITSFRYDAGGNQTLIINPLGHVTQNRYDARIRLVETIEATGSGPGLPGPSLIVGGTRTRYEYDEANRRTAIIDPVGNRTTFAYDARNRLVSETDPLGQVTTFAYDTLNRRTSKTDRNGRQITYAYDELDRLVTETWVAPGMPANVIQSTYFPNGQLLNVQDNFSSLTYSYDSRGRVATVDNFGTPGTPRVVVAYTYDAVGKVLTVSDTVNGVAGGVNAYTYDALNRLVQMTQTGAGVSDKRVDFGYNALNRTTILQRFSDLAGMQLVVGSTYQYDNLRRLTELVHNDGAADIAFYRTTYDGAGRIAQIVDVDGTRTYTHDDTSQLTAASYTGAQTDELFSYDSNGNRVGPGVVTGAANRLLSDGVFNYQYDNEGNLVLRTEIATGRVREFAWDHRNRLVMVTDRDAAGGFATQIVRYIYDALDRRIAKAVDATPQDAADAFFTHFAYDREDVLLEHVDADGAGANAPILSMRYLHGAGFDEVLALENFQEPDRVARVLWLLGDHLRTTRDLVDNAGALRNHIVFTSFGGLVSQTNPAFSTRYLFTSREFDAETGLYYYRARYYDPAIGRFLSDDPLRFAAGDANLSRYVFNNPLQLSDPTGQSTVFFLFYFFFVWTTDRCEMEYGAAIDASDSDRTQIISAVSQGPLLSEFNTLQAQLAVIHAKLPYAPPNGTGVSLSSQDFSYVRPGSVELQFDSDLFLNRPAITAEDQDLARTLVRRQEELVVQNQPNVEAIARLDDNIRILRLEKADCSAVEWLALATLGLLAGGRYVQRRRRRQEAAKAAGPSLTAAPRSPLDDVFAEIGRA